MEKRILTPGRRRGDAGFTLVEVVFSLVLLSIILVGALATTTDRLIVTMGSNDRQAVATQLAENRLEQVMLDPVYGSLETNYAGTEASIPNYPKFTRVTSFTHTYTTTAAGGKVDYETVTVKVSHPAMATPVTLTQIVSNQ